MPFKTEDIAVPKNLVFTVTGGRSGTNFLCDILNLLPEVTSVHEPEPRFDQFPIEERNNLVSTQKFLLNKKIPAIQSGTVHTSHYVESSHLFCKGFIEAWLSLPQLPAPNLILLDRDARKIAQSIFRLGAIPGRSEKGNLFYMHPESPIALTKMENWQAMNDYQLCYWYTQEIEQRKKHFSEIIERKGGKVVRTTAEALGELSEFYRVIEALGLPMPSMTTKLKYWFKRNKKVNTKSNRGEKFDTEHNSIAKLEKQVIQQLTIKSRARKNLEHPNRNSDQYSMSPE